MCLPTDGPAPAEVTNDRRPLESVSGEPVQTRDGDPLVDAKGRRSFVTSAGAGPSVGKHLLMAYLPPEHANQGEQLAVEYMGDRFPVTVAVAGSTPLFDPANERVKAASPVPA